MPTRSSPERLKTPENRNPPLSQRVPSRQRPAWGSSQPAISEPHHAAVTAAPDLLELPRARPTPPEPYSSPLESAKLRVDGAAQSSSAPPESAPGPAANALERLHSRLALVESQLAQCSAQLEHERIWSKQARLCTRSLSVTCMVLPHLPTGLATLCPRRQIMCNAVNSTGGPGAAAGG